MTKVLDSILTVDNIKVNVDVESRDETITVSIKLICK
jgi:hypothetical protein